MSDTPKPLTNTPSLFLLTYQTRRYVVAPTSSLAAQHVPDVTGAVVDAVLCRRITDPDQVRESEEGVVPLCAMVLPEDQRNRTVAEWALDAPQAAETQREALLAEIRRLQAEVSGLDEARRVRGGL